MALFRFKKFFYQGFPIFFIIAFMVLNQILDQGWGYWGEISPWITLICLWYWVVYQPALLPLWFIFVIGFVQDFYSFNTPYGTHTIVLMISFAVLLSQRSFIASQNFLVGWIMFALLAFLALYLRWGIICLLRWHIFSPTPILTSFLLTIGLYPLIFSFFSFINYLIVIGNKNI